MPAWRIKMLKLYSAIDDILYDNFLELAWPGAMYTKKPNHLGYAGNIRSNADTGEREYVLEVPGYGKEDITVTYLDNVLHISGELKDANGKVIKSFKRKTTFPDVDRTKIKANVRNGVLTVTSQKPTAQGEYKVLVE
jgi:HSP20 family molecular chaperone IbpA